MDKVCPHVKLVELNWLCSYMESKEFTEAKNSMGIKCTDCGYDKEDLWLCLMKDCKHVGCGRSNKKHALEHSQSLGHHVVIHLNRPSIWCYICDDEVNHPEDIVELIKKSAFPKLFQKDRPKFERISNSKRVKFNRGICGLENLGNTCFLNSVMQCMSNCYPLMKYFTTCDTEIKEAKSDLVKSFAEFMKEMWSGNYSSIKPTSILRVTSRINPMFMGYNQQDAQEFLRTIIDALHESLKKKSPISTNLNQSPKRSKEYEEKSMISNIFRGYFLCQVTCSVCLNISSVKEPFYDVSLTLPSPSDLSRIRNKSQSNQLWSYLPSLFVSEKIDLSECLKLFCSSEKLEGKDAYQCEKCKRKTIASRKVLLAELPEVLCLHLKRFKHNSYFGTKRTDVVNFPLQELDLSDCVTGIKKGECSYDLVGIVNHMGGLEGGHYIAFCKNYLNEKWYEFNDSFTREVDEKDVASQEAYLLFYRLRSPKHQQEVEKVKEMIEKNIEKEEVLYVQKSWYNTWETLSKKNISPIENECACPHNQLLPNCGATSESFVAVPLSVWNLWIESYGGGPVLQKLEVCEICSKERDLLEERKKMEHEQITLFDSKPKSDNDVYYLIAVEWIDLWRDFICSESNRIPGPICNHKLLVSPEKPVLRQDLVIRKDYRAIRKESWDYLFSIYGGGPAIPKNTNTSLL